jgi:hypothetical protein
MFTRSSASPSRTFSATTAGSSTILRPARSFLLMVLPFACPVHIPPNEMARPNARRRPSPRHSPSRLSEQPRSLPAGSLDEMCKSAAIDLLARGEVASVWRYKWTTRRSAYEERGICKPRCTGAAWLHDFVALIQCARICSRPSRLGKAQERASGNKSNRPWNFGSATVQETPIRMRAPACAHSCQLPSSRGEYRGGGNCSIGWLFPTVFNSVLSSSAPTKVRGL